MSEPVVITIARQLASGGSYIGRSVARRLGFTYVDRQILEQAARELGVEEDEIANRDGRLQSFWEKTLASFAMGALAGAYSPPPYRWITDEQMAEVSRRLILELTAKGPCVVLGRGGYYLLRNKSRVLNIMIHAPLEFRVERAMHLYSAPNKSEALKIIERSDQDRRRYVSALTGRDWFDCRNYHLTIDTGKVDFAAAEEMIVSLAKRLSEDNRWPWVNEPIRPAQNATGI